MGRTDSDKGEVPKKVVCGKCSGQCEMRFYGNSRVNNKNVLVI